MTIETVLLGTGPPLPDAVFVTHLHSDHICDLNDVIATHWVTSPEPRSLRLLGPPRLAEVVDGILAMLAPDIGYRLAHHSDLTWAPRVEVAELDPGLALDDGEVTVTAAAADHRPVEPTLAYRVDHAGHSVVIAGDTVPCTALTELCRGADVHVQTVLRDDLVTVRVPDEAGS